MKRLNLFFLSIIFAMSGFAQSANYLVVTISHSMADYDFLYLLPLDTIDLSKHVTNFNKSYKIPMYPFLLEETGWGADFIEDKDYGQCLGGTYWSDLRVFHSNYQKGTDLELIKKHRKVVQRIKKTWLEGRHIYAHKYTFYVTPIIADICSCQLFCKPNTTLYYIVRKGEFQIDNNFWKTKEWNTYVKYIDFSSLDYMLHQPVPPHIYHR